MKVQKFQTYKDKQQQRKIYNKDIKKACFTEWIQNGECYRTAKLQNGDYYKAVKFKNGEKV